LTNAWRVIVKRLRRLHGQEAIQYLAVVEQTQKGEPHLHILLRSPYIAQKLLSSWMGELVGAPIVDIRRIKSQKEVIRYVAKYVTKEVSNELRQKRFTVSKHYELAEVVEAAIPPTPKPAWHVDRRPLIEILWEWTYQGYACRSNGPDRFIGFKVDWYSP